MTVKHKNKINLTREHWAIQFNNDYININLCQIYKVWPALMGIAFSGSLPFLKLLLVITWLIKFSLCVVRMWRQPHRRASECRRNRWPAARTSFSPHDTQPASVTSRTAATVRARCARVNPVELISRTARPTRPPATASTPSTTGRRCRRRVDRRWDVSSCPAGSLTLPSTAGHRRSASTRHPFTTTRRNHRNHRRGSSGKPELLFRPLCSHHPTKVCVTLWHVIDWRQLLTFLPSGARNTC